VVKYLTAEVPGYQQSESTCGGVADQVQVADLLCDQLQACAGAECLYLRAENLAEGHVSEVKGGLVGNGCANLGSRSGGNDQDRAEKCIRHDIRLTWYKQEVACML
jgi:hypothetical protein